MRANHFCVGTDDVEVDDLKAFITHSVDDYGCWVVGTTPAITYAGYKGKYVVVRPYTFRTIGLDESYLHRIVWRLSHGRQEIPKGMHIAHECGERYENSHCFNPDHLFLRTPKENHAKMSHESRMRGATAGAEAIKSKWKDKEFRKVESAKIRARSDDPVYREKQRSASKKMYEDPKLRAKVSEKSKEMWKNQDSRDKLIKSLKQRYTCDECGHTTSKNWMTQHLNKTGHCGYTVVPV